MIIYIISFTDNGDLLNKKISKIFCDCDIRMYTRKSRTESLKEWTQKAFSDGDALIFVGAVGIAVRAISDFIKSKERDPAVIVCDELGKYVIPILSGHIGGANNIAERIGNEISAETIITTATDINGLWAVDSWAVKKNFKIYNVKNIKYISSALLEGKYIGLYSDIDINENLPKEILIGNTDTKYGIVISPYIKNIYKYTLNLIPKCVSIGVGTKKNVDENAVIEFFKKVFREKNIDMYSVCDVATINIKKNEKAILKFCQYMNLKIKYFSAEELNNVDGEFSKSLFVKKITGTDNVCERAAVLSSNFGKLIINKISNGGVTLAVALGGVRF